MNDEALVKEFLKGSREAFSELVKRHSRPLTTMILRMVRDQEEAKDISQKVFMRAFTGLPRFMLASSFKTWLYTIAINAVRDHLRSRKPQMASEKLDDVPDGKASPWERLDDARNLERMRDAIDQLPEKQRITMQLRIYEEMEYREIASVLGGTAAGARGNFFQAVKSLRNKLGGKE